MEDIQVCFDAENQIRIINPENFKETEALQEKCEDFTSSTAERACHLAGRYIGSFDRFFTPILDNPRFSEVRFYVEDYQY
jgi:predicted nucleic acid-binding protein